MRGVLRLESGDEVLLFRGVLLVPKRLHVGGHLLGELVVLERYQRAQTFDVAILLARRLREEFSAFDDLRDRLIKADGCPFALAALADALEDFCGGDKGRRDSGGRPGLSGRAPHRPAQRRRRRGHRQMREERPGIVGAAVNFGEHAVLNLGLDGAARVAVHAHGVNHVLRVHEVVEHIGAAVVENARRRALGTEDFFLIGLEQRGERTAQKRAIAKKTAARDRGWSRSHFHVVFLSSETIWGACLQSRLADARNCCRLKRRL